MWWGWGQWLREVEARVALSFGGTPGPVGVSLAEWGGCGRSTCMWVGATVVYALSDGGFAAAHAVLERKRRAWAGSIRLGDSHV